MENTELQYAKEWWESHSQNIKNKITLKHFFFLKSSTTLTDDEIFFIYSKEVLNKQPENIESNDAALNQNIESALPVNTELEKQPETVKEYNVGNGEREIGYYWLIMNSDEKVVGKYSPEDNSWDLPGVEHCFFDSDIKKILSKVSSEPDLLGKLKEAEKSFSKIKLLANDEIYLAERTEVLNIINEALESLKHIKT